MKFHSDAHVRMSNLKKLQSSTCPPLESNHFLALLLAVAFAFPAARFRGGFLSSPAADPSDLPGFADGHFGITCLPGGDDGQKGGEGWCNVVIQGNWKPVG